MAEVESNWVIVLALLPKISHSLFRTGTEKLNLTKHLSISIDKDLVRDKPMELVTKAQNVRSEAVLPGRVVTNTFLC